MYLFLATAQVMHSLNQEIKAFSRNNLRKQCTRVTTLTGKKIIETWKDARIHVVEEVEPSGGGGCGYVQDLSLDLNEQPLGRGSVLWRMGAELELRRCGSSLGPSQYRLASTRRQPASSLPRSGHWAPNLGPK